MDLRPLAAFNCPFPRYVYSGDVEHLKKCVVIRENSFVFRHFSKLPIEILNGVGRVDDRPNLLRKFEIGRKLRPMLPP